MSVKTDIDRKTLRRQATIKEIVDAAWELSRANGLGNFSMRELGDAVGMRAQSLYSYFESKNEIFDAMFADGNRAFVDEVSRADVTVSAGEDPIAAATEVAHRFFDFCINDPTRYQLLFQRTIPGFEPSAESYAIAEEAYRVSVAPLRELGFADSDLDLATAVLTGLVAQQLANEPSGDRWRRLVDRATRMLVDEVQLETRVADAKGA